MFGGVITTLLLLALVAGLVIYNKKKIESEGRDFDRNEIIGEYGIEVLAISILLLWIVPWGLFIIIPVILLISSVSPVGRYSW